MELLDLHVHTTASDGQYTPSEIAMLAKKANLSVLAITDHDTVSGIKEARTACEKNGIQFISGIEISTQLTEEIHILGYQIDEDNEMLLSECGRYEVDRQNRGERICGFLKTKGIDVDIDEVRGIAGTGSLGRPHFAAYLMKHGIVASRKEAFDIYLDTDEFKAATDRQKPSPKEAIELIHKAGGKAVIAHPGLLKMDRDEQEKLIEILVECGLDGIECFYGKHSEEQTRYYLGLVKRFDLKTSCGSDFHGELVKPDVLLGMKLETIICSII